MAASAILDIWNLKILLAGGVQRADMHQLSKFRQNWLIRCEDIDIFFISMMAAAAI